MSMHCSASPNNMVHLACCRVEPQRSESFYEEENAAEEEEILGSDDDEQEDPKDYCKGE